MHCDIYLFCFYFQSPKYAPPIEFVDPKYDQAALSPPEGYKDGGLQQALGGVLGSHIFGAQHIQQLQVIQRLQAKRAAMLAAQRSNNNGTTNQSGSSKSHPVPPPPPQAQTICTECAECTECAAKQEHDEGMYHSHAHHSTYNAIIISSNEPHSKQSTTHDSFYDVIKISSHTFFVRRLPQKQPQIHFT